MSYEPSELVSDLDVYTECRKNGWALYTSDHLHAKLYSLGLGSGWLGSANLTRSALGLRTPANDELLYYVEPLPPEARAWVLGLIQRARFVTQELHALHVEWLASCPPPPPTPLPRLTLDQADPFLLSQLPASTSPRQLWETWQRALAYDDPAGEAAAGEHDAVLYGVAPAGLSYEEFLVQLRPAFERQPFVAAFLSAVRRSCGRESEGREGIHFGGAKEWVQSNCTAVPVPHGRALTPLVQNLFSWCGELLPDEVEVVRPNHSQVIRVSQGSRGGEPLGGPTQEGYVNH